MRAIHPLAGGHVAVTTTPATIAQAYSRYRVGISGTLDQLGAYVVDDAPAAALDVRAHAARAKLLSVTSAELDCKGAGAGPTVSFDADFSKMDFSAYLDPYSPELVFHLIGSPTINLDVGLSATSCTYNGRLKIVIPIPGTPLQVVLKPAFSFGANGTLGIQVSWKPSIVLGFQRGNALADSDTHIIKWGSPTVTPHGEAGADVFFGAEADLTLGGRVGVDAQVGPDFEASIENDPTACLTIDGALKAQLSAFADVFVKHWSFALFSGTFYKKQLWNGCLGGGTPSVSVTNPGSQTSTLGTPVSLQIHASDTDGGALSYSARGLPAGLSISPSTGLITGTPATGGSSSVTVTATDATGPSNSATFTWTIAPSLWAIQSGPVGQDGALLGVSCTSDSSCVGVGEQMTATSGWATLVEIWDGASWQVQPTPNPAGGHDSGLFGVSCTSSSACTAVGNYLDSSDATHVLVERWDGVSWQIQSAPDAPGGGFLYGVSCTSSTACTAVGGQVTGAGTTEATLAESWDGSTWQIESTVDIPNATETYLRGVSCTSADACVAVGTYQYPPPNPGSGLPGGGTLAEVWDGTSWQVQATPGGSYDGLLLGVSCTSSSACTAVGQSTDGSGTVAPLAERWDGTSWRVQAADSPAGGVVVALYGVSCSQAGRCIAVGENQNSTGVDTLAEGWAGVSWQIQSTPNPDVSPGGGSALDAVSCTTSTTCTAVGSTTDRGTFTLAERYSGP